MCEKCIRVIFCMIFFHLPSAACIRRIVFRAVDMVTYMVARQLDGRPITPITAR